MQPQLTQREKHNLLLAEHPDRIIPRWPKKDEQQPLNGPNKINYEMLVEDLIATLEEVPILKKHNIRATWYDANKKEMKALQKECDYYYTIWKKFECEANYKVMVEKKRNYKSAVMRLSNEYIHNLLETINMESKNHHSKEFFELIKGEYGAFHGQKRNSINKKLCLDRWDKLQRLITSGKERIRQAAIDE